jgi:transposase
MKQNAAQGDHDMREVFNALRWFVRAGCPWRKMPNDLPPWFTCHQQTMRWMWAGCFGAIAHDLRTICGHCCACLQGDTERRARRLCDRRMMQSSPESGARAGYDGCKRRKGSKIHEAVDTLGHLLATKVSPADQQDRDHVATPGKEIQEATGDFVEFVFVDLGHTGANAAAQAATHGIRLEVVKLSEAMRASCFCPDDGSSKDPSTGQRVSAALHATTLLRPIPGEGPNSLVNPWASLRATCLQFCAPQIALKQLGSLQCLFIHISPGK